MCGGECMCGMCGVCVCVCGMCGMCGVCGVWVWCVTVHILTLNTVCLDPVIFRVLWSLATVFATSAADMCVGGEGCMCEG